MKSKLVVFLQPCDHLYINSKHHIEKLKYGLYDPPTRKQLINLRFLLESLGVVKEVEAEQLLGFSKAECNAYLKRLKQLHTFKLHNR